MIGQPLARGDVFWPLFKGCLITTISMVLVMYVLHFISPRGVMMFFGVLSFLLISLKEELVRWGMHSKFAQLQYKRRFILIATGGEIARLRRELKKTADQSVEIVAELSLEETPVTDRAPAP